MTTIIQRDICAASSPLREEQQECKRQQKEAPAEPINQNTQTVQTVMTKEPYFGSSFPAGGHHEAGVHTGFLRHLQNDITSCVDIYMQQDKQQKQLGGDVGGCTFVGLNPV